MKKTYTDFLTKNPLMLHYKTEADNANLSQELEAF